MKVLLGRLAVALLLAGCSPPFAATPTVSPSAPSSSPPFTPELTPSTAQPLTVSALQRLNGRVGFIAARTGTGVRLEKTSDNGATWERLSVPADYLVGLRFVDEQVGWVAGVAGDRDVVLRTQDGGRSWQTVLTVDTGFNGANPVGAIQAVDGLRAWALTLEPASCPTQCRYDLQRTTDGGKTWTLLERNVTAMRFASANRGWVALGDAYAQGIALQQTSDGGATWTTVLRPTTGNILSLDAATIDEAWVLTRDGAYCSASNCDRYTLYRTDDGARTWSNLGNPKDFTRNCSGGHLAGPLFASPSRGWFGIDLGAGGANVGPGGMLTSNDGGWTWRCATTPPNVTVVSAADPVHVWAASHDRISQTTTLYTTEDGGATWRALSLSALG